MIFNSSLLLSNAYSEQVISTVKSFENIKRAISGSGQVRVLIIGDSVSAGTDCGIDQYNFAGMIKQAFTTTVGSRLVFENFAVGGKTIKNFNDDRFIPEALWNQDYKTWMDAAKDFRADIVFVALGVNSTNLSDMTTYKDDTLELIRMFSAIDTDVCLINNLELGREPYNSTANQRLHNIATTQANIARNQENNCSCIDANRIYKLLVHGIDFNSFETYQQPMWINEFTNDWTSGSGLSRTTSLININSNDKSATTLKHKLRSRDVLFEGTLKLAGVNLGSTSKMVMCARENGAMSHVVGVLFIITINSQRDFTLKIASSKGTFAQGTFTTLNSSDDNVGLRLSCVGAVATIEVKYRGGDWEEVLMANIPQCDFEGAPYFQFEHMQGLKLENPFFAHSMEKKCTPMLDGYKAIYGPTGKPNGGNQVNHPCDHAFAFLYSDAIKQVLNLIR